jgi:hypothetical protein
LDRLSVDRVAGRDAVDFVEQLSTTRPAVLLNEDLLNRASISPTQILQPIDRGDTDALLGKMVRRPPFDVVRDPDIVDVASGVRRCVDRDIACIDRC